MVWDTQKLAFKDMKNIENMASCHAWLCPAYQIELSVKSYQTELSNSETITPTTRLQSSKSKGREGSSSLEGLMG